MTLEEAQARIKVLEVEAEVIKVSMATATTNLTTATTKITKLNDENAERRVLNNHQKKQLYVTKGIIAKNNIKVDYEKIGTDSLTLDKETGQVVGEVAYNPASSIEVGGGVPPASKGAPTGMTIESIQGMNRVDIAKNWDAVAAVLANQPTE